MAWLSLVLYLNLVLPSYGRQLRSRYCWGDKHIRPIELRTRESSRFKVHELAYAHQKVSASRDLQIVGWPVTYEQCN